ncbi:MAG TPA: hypothetical protein VK666_16360, partial [Chryseolinea sp.]|nr:hypothetical protein [Chryseolinea sp.]
TGGTAYPWQKTPDSTGANSTVPIRIGTYANPGAYFDLRGSSTVLAAMRLLGGLTNTALAFSLEMSLLGELHVTDATNTRRKVMMVPNPCSPGQYVQLAPDGIEWQCGTPGGASNWGAGTPTLTIGPGGVVGSGASVSLEAGSTNEAGRITLNTGTSGTGFLLTGQLFQINFSTTGGSSSGPKLLFFPAELNAAALFSISQVYASKSTNIGALNVNGSGAALSTTYTFNYSAFK